MNLKFECKICNYKAKNFKNLSNHIRYTHNINSKKYFNQYFKKENMGICLICGKETKFINLSKGYGTYCSRKCKNIDNKRVLAEICLERYGTTNTLCLPQVKNKRNESLENNKFEINTKRKQWWTDENKKNVNNTRQTTCLERYGVTNVLKVPEIREKIESIFLIKYNARTPFESQEIQNKINQTFITKYGAKRCSHTEEYKEKYIETCLKRYNSQYYLSSDLRKERLIASGDWRSNEVKKEYEIYSELVWKETRKHIKTLFENWNGLDFYTGEKLLTDPKFGNYPQYRTIDHKISISYGFYNQINPEIIGNLINLCICSRLTNTKKNYRCWNEELKCFQ